MSKEKVDFLNDINSFIGDSKLFLKNLLLKVGWSSESLNNKLNRDVINEDIISQNTVSSGNSKSNIKAISCGSSDISMDVPHEVSSISKESKGKTTLELLSQQRDMKRRRISYKGRIHTKNRSHNEILREVIAQQMEALEDNEGDSNSSVNVKNNKNVSEPETRIVDVSGFRVQNPHIAWKQVVQEVVSRENDKLEKDKSKYGCKPNKYDDRIDHNVKPSGTKIKVHGHRKNCIEKDDVRRREEKKAHVEKDRNSEKYSSKYSSKFYSQEDKSKTNDSICAQDNTKDTSSQDSSLKNVCSDISLNSCKLSKNDCSDYDINDKESPYSHERITSNSKKYDKTTSCLQDIDSSKFSNAHVGEYYHSSRSSRSEEVHHKKTKYADKYESRRKESKKHKKHKSKDKRSSSRKKEKRKSRSRERRTK